MLHIIREIAVGLNRGGVMSSFYNLVASVGLATFAFVAPAAAQQACICTLPPAQTGASVGNVTSVKGEVLASHTVGYVPATPALAISVGSRLMVGPNSSAEVAFGNQCRVRVQGDSTLRVDPVESGVCIQIDGNQAGGAISESSQGVAVLAAGGVAAALGGIIYVATRDDDKKVSD